jgi:hypothetical protein
LSGLHIPDAQGIWLDMLQLPLPSQVGVTMAPPEQVAVPQVAPAG